MNLGVGPVNSAGGGSNSEATCDHVVSSNFCAMWDVWDLRLFDVLLLLGCVQSVGLFEKLLVVEGERFVNPGLYDVAGVCNGLLRATTTSLLGGCDGEEGAPPTGALRRLGALAVEGTEAASSATSARTGVLRNGAVRRGAMGTSTPSKWSLELFSSSSEDDIVEDDASSAESMVVSDRRSSSLEDRMSVSWLHSLLSSSTTSVSSSVGIV